MSEFFDTFNAALPAMEAEFGENWIFKGRTYPAISIDHESDSSRAMKGGEFLDSNTTIYVRKAIFLSSQIKEGDSITARGQEFAVLAIEQDGDDSRGLVCGPSQIDVWKH